MEGHRETAAVPVGFDAHFLVGIEILSLEKPVKPFDKKGKVVLLIHSPAILFKGEDTEKVPGKTYMFTVTGETKDGHPVFSGAEMDEREKRGKKP